MLDTSLSILCEAVNTYMKEHFFEVVEADVTQALEKAETSLVQSLADREDPLPSLLHAVMCCTRAFYTIVQPNKYLLMPFAEGRSDVSIFDLMAQLSELLRDENLVDDLLFVMRHQGVTPEEILRECIRAGIATLVDKAYQEEGSYEKKGQHRRSFRSLVELAPTTDPGL